MEKLNLKFLVIIIDRNKSDKIVELLKSSDANCINVIRGTGTAKSEILEILGIGNTEKSVIISTVLANNLGAIYKKLKSDEFNIMAKGNGIAFTIPISSVGGPASLYILCGGKIGEKV